MSKTLQIILIFYTTVHVEVSFAPTLRSVLLIVTSLLVLLIQDCCALTTYFGRSAYLNPQSEPRSGTVIT